MNHHGISSIVIISFLFLFPVTAKAKQNKDDKPNNSPQASSPATTPGFFYLSSIPLYDDLGNAFVDGNYKASVIVSDAITGETLYSEEQTLKVMDGFTQILIGDGVPVSGDLFSEALLSANDGLSVSVVIDGVEQEVAVLGSQPFSYVSEIAYSVLDDSIGSSQIKDGSITLSDLSENLVDELLASVSASSSESDANGEKGPKSHPNFVLKITYKPTQMRSATTAMTLTH